MAVLNTGPPPSPLSQSRVAAQVPRGGVYVESRVVVERSRRVAVEVKAYATTVQVIVSCGAIKSVEPDQDCVTSAATACLIRMAICFMKT